MTEAAPALSVEGFTLLAELPAGRQRREFRAQPHSSDEIVRLVVFDADVSARPEFRRAFKTDRAVLSLLQHASILSVQGTGESDGLLYYWTPWTESAPLAERLVSGPAMSAEDVIEIGWQVCSALQHAHNLGLPHGGLSEHTVLLSDALQAELTDFGVPRWLQALDKAGQSGQEGALITISALASREDVERDLLDLAQMLQRLRQPAGPDVAARSANALSESERDRTAVEAALDRLLERIQSPEVSGLRLTSAREFQGRLGEILIGGDADAMPLLDQRDFSGNSRRSIVQELFESDTLQVARGWSKPGAAGTASGLPILPVLVMVVAAVLLALAAGWLM